MMPFWSSLKPYLRFWPNGLPIGLSFFLNLATVFWLLKNIPRDSASVFLHYTASFGVDRIGPWWGVLAIPVFGFSILVLNAFVGWNFFPKEKMVGILLNSGTLLCTILLFINALLLVFLNA